MYNLCCRFFIFFIDRWWFWSQHSSMTTACLLIHAVVIVYMQIISSSIVPLASCMWHQLQNYNKSSSECMHRFSASLWNWWWCEEISLKALFPGNVEKLEKGLEKNTPKTISTLELIVNFSFFFFFYSLLD